MSLIISSCLRGGAAFDAPLMIGLIHPSYSGRDGQSSKEAEAE